MDQSLNVNIYNYLTRFNLEYNKKLYFQFIFYIYHERNSTNSLHTGP